MKSKDSRIIIENQQSDFLYQKSKSNLNITFNRISFIFFVFFIIFFIYSIHLIHLGSRKISVDPIDDIVKTDKLYRADIVDRNQEYLVKTINSIDIGISPTKIIDEKKLLINLKLIFPNKDFSEVKKNIKKGKFFYFEKRISEENYEKLMRLGDKSIEPKENLIRVYPQKNLFSHIIGQIDNDNNGISGLEKSLDGDLKNTQDPIILTVDKDIQFLIRNELDKFNVLFSFQLLQSLMSNIDYYFLIK